MSNPGGLRWFVAMGSAIARAGLLRAYITPITSLKREREIIDRVLPDFVSTRILAELQRRPVPEGAAEHQVQRVAATAELLAVAAARAGAPRSITLPMGLRRSRLFDRRVSVRIRSGDKGVVASVSAARETLRVARRLGVPAYLDYPIAHHRFSEAVLREEAKLQPRFARTLQLQEENSNQWRRIEDEIRLADKIFVLSSFQRRTFMEAGVDERKLVLTPLGVDLELFRPAFRKMDGIFRVMFAGQLTQRKGLSYLIDGFRRAAIPNSELLLVGGIVGSSAPWADTPGIRHVPHVPQWELPALYALSDVFVFPSLVEGFPQTPLEAMACGLPVIVSEHTFATDVLTDGNDGYVIPIRDPEAIASRLLHLHRDEVERERMGTTARHRAEAFSWERYGDRVVASLKTR